MNTSSTTDASFDVLVLGAGPAGAAAACSAVRQKLRVAILDRRGPVSAPAHPEWLHPDARQLLERSGVPLKPLHLGVVDRVEFIDPARSARATAALAVPVPIVDSTALTARLLDAAVRDGVVFHPAEDVQAIEAKENSVILHGKDGGRRTGRLLIAADGCDSLAVRTFGLRRPGVSERCDVCCQAAVPLPASAVRSKPETRDLLKWILTAEDLSSFGYIFRAGRDLVIGLVSPPPATGAAAEIRQTFARVVAAWQKAEIIPGHLGVDASNVEIRPVPRGLALERDTHVAKHSLVIGDAGGFVVAISHEGLHPALMSGMLAAEVCAQALESSYPQDVLAEFDTKWRVGLAEFLRSPNADLRFLLPLVFTNARIAGRIANWFLCVKTPRTSEAP